MLPVDPVIPYFSVEWCVFIIAKLFAVRSSIPFDGFYFYISVYIGWAKQKQNALGVVEEFASLIQHVEQKEMVYFL